MAELRRFIWRPENKATIVFALAVIGAALLPFILRFELGRPWYSIPGFSNHVRNWIGRFLGWHTKAWSVGLAIALIGSGLLDCSLAFGRRLNWKANGARAAALVLALATWIIEIAYRSESAWEQPGDYIRAAALAAVGACLSGWMWNRRMKLSAAVNSLYWCVLVFCMASNFEWLFAFIKPREEI